ncbi:hypothetical protein BKA70DRAFT_1565238 [Coprinopsis sp. MPI-PUGE-AT-0042]|nr:hypothetical protein BKA70DRAFT_1565238 [Coprinopsis sp. MPI-PUGE-AT-0042]
MSTVGVNINVLNMHYSSNIDAHHYSHLPLLPMCPAYDVQGAYHMSLVSPNSNVVSSPPASPSSSASTPPSSPSPPPCQSRKRKPKKIRTTIPRPPNAFILFRSDFWAREKQKLNPIERNHRDISRIAGHCWRNLDPISKQRYYERAIQLRDMHRRQYPDYKFKPSVKKSRVEMKDLPSEEDARCAHLASTLMPEFLGIKTSSIRALNPSDPTEFSQPTVDPLWDDPFGLTLTDLESIIYSSFGCTTHEKQENLDCHQVTTYQRHDILQQGSDTYLPSYEYLYPQSHLLF